MIYGINNGLCSWFWTDVYPACTSELKQINSRCFLSDRCYLFGQFLDYRSYVVQGSVRDNPALERSVMMCNGVSQWVQLMILSRHTAQQRAQVFIKFIHVAQVNWLKGQISQKN